MFPLAESNAYNHYFCHQWGACNMLTVFFLALAAGQVGTPLPTPYERVVVPRRCVKVKPLCGAAQAVTR